MTRKSAVPTTYRVQISAIGPFSLLFNRPQAFLGEFGRKRFDDAESMEGWCMKDGAVIKREECKMESVDSYGWCGLDAINVGLSELQLPPIAKADALETLSRTEDDIRREGMCINELECLLN